MQHGFALTVSFRLRLDEPERVVLGVRLSLAHSVGNAEPLADPIAIDERKSVGLDVPDELGHRERVPLPVRFGLGLVFAFRHVIAFGLALKHDDVVAQRLRQRYADGLGLAEPDARRERLDVVAALGDSQLDDDGLHQRNALLDGDGARVAHGDCVADTVAFGRALANEFAVAVRLGIRQRHALSERERQRLDDGVLYAVTVSIALRVVEPLGLAVRER